MESFLTDIAIVLGVAALTSAVTQRLRLPTVLGYMLAGLLIGPYIPVPLFADQHRVETLSEFGVILVMFAVGLEFRLKRFFEVLPSAGITAALEMLVMGLVGVSIGYLFNWTTAQSIFLGASLSISSTMIVSKIFEETKPEKNLKEHIFSVLIIQDIVAILILTVLGTFAASSQLQISELVPTVGKLLLVLISSTVAGLFVIPRLIRYVAKLGNYEVLTIVSVGTCFSVALAVEKMGYSVALGAFLAGILVSESGEAKKVERLVAPLKNVFAAVFFVSVGMTVNPKLAMEYLPYSFFVSVVVVSFQFLSVTAGGILSGVGIEKSMKSSIALGQIGEFAFIIAAIGIGAGIVGPEFQAIIVTVAVLTSLTTPLLWKNSEKIATSAVKFFPKRLRVSIGLYEAWLKHLNIKANKTGVRIFGVSKKVIASLIVDTILLIALPPTLLNYLPDITRSIGSYVGILIVEEAAVLLITVLIMAPVLYIFVINLSQLIKQLSNQIFAGVTTPTKISKDAQKFFSMVIWILAIFLLGPLMASVLKPFEGSQIFFIVLIIVATTALVGLWRSAGVITEDFESGGGKIVSVLRRQTYTEKKEKSIQPKIPGLDGLETITMANPHFDGKTISEVNLRNKTGVTLVSITREQDKILFPGHQQVLQLGDSLVIWGEDDSKKAAIALLSEFKKKD
jgi:CPA2 family monovalent cation:H+ antiporter-2